MNISNLRWLALVMAMLAAGLLAPAPALADSTGTVLSLGGSMDLYNAELDQTVRVTFERDWLPLSNLFKVTVWDQQDPEIVWSVTFKKGTSRTIKLATQQFKNANMTFSYNARTEKLTVTDGGGWS